MRDSSHCPCGGGRPACHDQGGTSCSWLRARSGRDRSRKRRRGGRCSCLLCTRERAAQVLSVFIAEQTGAGLSGQAGAKLVLRGCPWFSRALQAVYLLKAERIGHGYHVLEDPELYKELLRAKMHFEVSGGRVTAR